MELDRAAAEGFVGSIVRKDLVRRFARQYPMPTYVCEFLLGRYCASLVLMPVMARKQLADLSDEMATKVNVLFYGDVREAFVKAIGDCCASPRRSREIKES